VVCELESKLKELKGIREPGYRGQDVPLAGLFVSFRIGDPDGALVHQRHMLLTSRDVGLRKKLPYGGVVTSAGARQVQSV